MNQIILLTALVLCSNSLAQPPKVHGPICSWHLDPTSTMTIQWIERVEAEAPEGQWMTAQAGFGYADDDDATTLAIRDKHQQLYIRKEFELRALPTDPAMSVLGTWDAVSKVLGREVKTQVEIGYNFRQRKMTGKVLSENAPEIDLKAIEVAGKTLFLEWDFEFGGSQLTAQVDAEETERGTLEGRTKILKANGEVAVTGEWSAVLVPETVPRRRGGGRRGQRAREQQSGSGDEVNVSGDEEKPIDASLVLKVNYDDGFIAYLNGVEVARANVTTNDTGKVTDIESHEAEGAEEFVLKDEHLKLLKVGKNHLAFVGYNSELDSSDFTLDPALEVRINDRDRAIVKQGDDWQFYLGNKIESDWHATTSEATPFDPAKSLKPSFQLRYGKRGTQRNQEAWAEPLAFADTGNVVHRVVLKGLAPDTAYSFTIHHQGDDVPLKYGRWFFRTAPNSFQEGLRFVTGGDMYHKRDLLDSMNRRAGLESPHFALLGGDLAYANGKDEQRWYHWVDSWAEHAINDEDCSIPMIAVIGNHECSEDLMSMKDDSKKLAAFNPIKAAKFYYSLFPLPQDVSNYTVDFGNYLSIICLDSGHTQLPAAQAYWLDTALKARQGFPNLFACYHRPAYGTLVKPDNEDIRDHWVPLFERYGVDVAFENDHHVYKRTQPIREGAVARDGVTYMGDGSWGVDVREIKWERLRRKPYLVRGESINHLISVTLYQDRQEFRAVDKDGKPVDHYVRFP